MCLPSLDGGDEEFTFSPDGDTVVLQRARRGARGSMVDELRPVRVARRWQRGAEESHRRQSGLGHPAGVPEEWRSRLAGDEAARVRGRSIRHQGAPSRRGARRRRAVGSFRLASRRVARRPHAAGHRQRPGADAAVRDRTGERQGVAPVGRWQRRRVRAGVARHRHCLARPRLATGSVSIEWQGRAPAAHQCQCGAARCAHARDLRAVQLPGLERRDRVRLRGQTGGVVTARRRSRSSFMADRR